MDNSIVATPLWTHIIGEVGRGANAARDLPREEAEALFRAWLADEAPELVQGALWAAYRIKGESVAELQGFLAATEASQPPLAQRCWLSSSRSSRARAL